MIINAGMLCDVAGNGKEALAAIEPASYHLVLMNLVMPEMCGGTATRILRQQEAEQGWRRLPVIGIFATPSNEEACVAAGMDDCIEKPIEEAELLKIVDTFIQHDDHRTTGHCSPRNIILDWAQSTSTIGGGTSPVDSMQTTQTDESPAAFRVLLAEDSRANQMAITRLLRAQGVDGADARQ